MNSKDLFTELVIHPDAASATKCMEPLFRWIGPERPKSLALYTYARNCKVGPIIELGTWHGQGTIPLALGARDAELGVQVITIDPFTDRGGWTPGEYYYEGDYDVFRKNIITTDVKDLITLIRKESKDALRFCDSYELFFWDIGGRSLVGDYIDWKDRCSLGGTFIVKDLGTWGFGFNHVLEHAVESHMFVPSTSCVKGCLWSMYCINNPIHGDKT